MLACPFVLCVCLTFASNGWLQSASDRDRLRADVVEAIAQGRYADGVRAARALLASVELSDGTGSIESVHASDLLVEALVGHGDTAAVATLTLAQRVLRKKEALLRADDPDLSVSLHNLAAIRVERGEPAIALPLDERGLALRLRGQTPAADIADSRERLAWTLMQMERLDPASRQLALALEVREREAEARPLALAKTLELTGWLNLYQGDYSLARARLVRGLELRTGAPDHPSMARLQLLMGDLLWFEGDGRGAIGAWTSAARLVAWTLGPEHPSIVGLQRRLAFANDALGNRLEAQHVLGEALRLGERRLTPCHPELLAVRSQTAGLASSDGDFPEARRRYVASRSAYERCLGPHHSDTATMVYNLALVAARMGALDEAERLHQQTIRDWSAGLGPAHPFVVRGWEGLAEVAAARGQHARARSLYERVLAARRKATPPSQALIAWTLTNLGRTLVDLGNLTRAHAAVAEAIAIFQRAGVAEDPDYLARALSLRGEIEVRRGEVVAGRASLQEALSARQQIFGRSHPLTAHAEADVAKAALQAGDLEAALSSALVAEGGGRDHLRFTIRYLPERQAVQYAARRPRGLDVALSTGVAMTTNPSPSASRVRLLDAVIKSRGVILEELATRARTTLAESATLTPLLARAARARQRYANLVVRTLQDSAPRTRNETLPHQQLDEARREKEDAEQALAEASAGAGAEVARAETGLDTVRAALPADAALVSFVRYDRTMVEATPPMQEGQEGKRTGGQKGQATGSGGARARWRAPIPSYAAFVLKPGATEPALVPLGSAASIDGLVAAWRREASGQTLIAGASRADALRAYRLAGLRLRRAIWDPLVTPLATATRIFIVPDGQLNVVNFAALPTSPGRFLADESVLLHYVSTERDLAMPAAAAASTGLLAVGGATFDGQSAAPDPTAARSACEAFSRMRFPALPGSRREVADITQTWPNGDTRDVTVLSGTAATETAVKRAAGGRRVVHLATHGFFLGGECIPGVAGTRGVGGLARRPSASTTDTDNPLLLSGLALAWANRRDKARTGEDDGILTAEEIAGLDLQGTEWAVLSACDTGLGEIRAGEGVFGLRRAFQVAGARTVIMSLWSVQDTAAREWMRALYDGRFRQQRSTAEAVREASRAVLAARRAKGHSTHPFFWAGFVAAGDWR